MASYVPAGNNVRHWQSQAESAGPVRANKAQVSRSGSRRSFASTAKPSVNFSRASGILQNTTAQYGNYLLYRDQVNYANDQLRKQQAAEKDKELQQGVGNAAASMLGGPSGYSPNKQKAGAKPFGGGHLGPPSTASSQPVGPSSPKQTAKVVPTATPQENAQAWGASPAWATNVDEFGTNKIGRQARPPEPSSPMTTPDSQSGFKRPSSPPPGLSGKVLEPGVEDTVGGEMGQLSLPFGRQPHQPTLSPGNTSPRTETQRKDARNARERPTGMNPNARFNF